MKIIHQKKKLLVSYAIITLFVALPNLASAAGWNIDALTGFGLPGSSIKNIIEKFLLWILGILSFLGVIGFAVSGIMYLTSAGEDDRMKTAKQAMQYSIIGLIVGMSGVVAIMAVEALLKGNGGI
jgi:hypothetical protein